MFSACLSASVRDAGFGRCHAESYRGARAQAGEGAQEGDPADAFLEQYLSDLREQEGGTGSVGLVTLSVVLQ